MEVTQHNVTNITAYAQTFGADQCVDEFAVLNLTIVSGETRNTVRLFSSNVELITGIARALQEAHNANA